ncbi:MAG: DinB family protein [Pirellulales bacterium]
MKTHIERMVAAMRWADERVVGALANCLAAQEEALPLVSHLLAAEHVWLARLERRAAVRPVWPALMFADCEALAAENAAGYAAYLDRLSDDGLAEVIQYQNSQGVEFATSVVDILTHVVIHGAYHRGQIAKALGRAGTQAVNTDYNTYVRTVDQQ